MLGPVKPTLVNPPTTLREYDREQAAKKATVTSLAEHFSTICRETPDCSHDPGSTTARVYDAITLDRFVVAQHCKGLTLDNAERIERDTRFVLWHDSDEVRNYARGLLVLADYVDQLNAERAAQAS